VGDSLGLAVSGRDGVRRLMASGVIDGTTVRDLIARVWTAGEADTETIIVDLAAVTSIDVSGVGALFALKDLMGRLLRVEAAAADDRSEGNAVEAPGTADAAASRLLAVRLPPRTDRRDALPRSRDRLHDAC